MPVRARKRFGQNFLQDVGVLAQCVASLGLRPQDHWVEIGPGRGALTQALVGQVATLTAIEIDRDLLALLYRKFQASKHFTLINQDVLQTDWQTLYQQRQAKLRVVGNLPYNISTAILLRLSQARPWIEDIHVMLQREVALRICAKPGEKNYGRLTVMLHYYFQAEHLFDIAPDAFTPVPKVVSSWLRLTPRQQLLPLHDSDCFAAILLAAFGQRRKTLRNSLKNKITAVQLAALGIDANQRAENLSLVQFLAIANACSQLSLKD